MKKIITTKYKGSIALAIMIFAVSLFLLFILKGKEYFLGGLFIVIIYFLFILSSKSISIIELEDKSITFNYYFFGFIKRKAIYDINSLSTNVKRIVSLKGGINFYIFFHTKADNKKIFEISLRDLVYKDDFTFLENLFV